jgi:hypothetical protein
MNTYRLKEGIWVAVLILGAVIVLTGCSSTPKQSKLVSADQYCHTSQTIVRENGNTVNSKTTLNCSDDPAEKYVPAKLGLAKDCVAVHIPMNRNGRVTQERIYACQKYDGTFSVIDSASVR